MNAPHVEPSAFRADTTHPALASGVSIVATVAGATYVGTGPDWAVVVRGPQAALRCWLDNIDGRFDLSGQLDQAERFGLERADAAALLEQLLASGMVIDAQRASGAARPPIVVVIGHAGVAAHLIALAEETRQVAGRVPVLKSFRMPRVGTNRINGADPRPAADPRVLASATLVVLVLDRAVADAEEMSLADDIAALGIPSLVVAATPVSRVGPLVVPGITPCLRCEDIGRAERNQDWREIGVRWALEQPPEPARLLVELTCGEAARRLQAILDRGVDRTVGDDRAGDLLALSQTRSGGGAWEHHHPIRHPACGCRWQNEPA